MKPTILIVGKYAHILESTIDFWFPEQFSILTATNLPDLWQQLSLTTPQETHSILLGLSPGENKECVQTLQDWSIEGSNLREELNIVIVAEDYAEQQCQTIRGDGWLNTWPALDVTKRVRRLVTQYEQTVRMPQLI